MKRPIRFYVAIFMARSARFLLKKLKRNATHFPGQVARTICFDFLKYLQQPTHLIGVTGTNGKTTVSNMILDVFKAQRIEVANNKLGSNITEGVITALLDATTFFGNRKSEWGVLEIDERASLRIFPYIKPDVLVVTNLFRDSYKRNAHIEFIVDLLNKYIPETTHLIVNGDDLIASMLCAPNSRTTFGILPQENELQVRDSIINDLVYCPNCENRLNRDFVRYHHVGIHHCESCGFKSLPLDVHVKTLDVALRRMVVESKGVSCKFRLVGSNITDAYNMIAMISVFLHYGKTLSEISSIVDTLSIVESRFDEIAVGNKRVIGLLAKDQNPVANSRVFDFIRRETSWGKVAILFANEVYAHVDNPDEVENMAWIYDTDMEYLNQEHVSQLIVGGHRRYDFYARMRMAGIPKSKIVIVDKEEDEIRMIDSSIDTVVLLYSTKNIPIANRMKKEIAKHLVSEVNV